MEENFPIHLNIIATGLLTAALLGAGLFGIIATLSPLHSRPAPRLGFPALLAGAWGLLLACAAASVADRLFGPSVYGVLGFAVGYGLGVLAGLDAGRRLAAFYLRDVWPRRAGRAAPGRPAS